MVKISAEILDDLQEQDQRAIIKKRVRIIRNWLLVSIFALAGVNTLLTHYLFPDPAILFGSNTIPILVFTLGTTFWGFLAGLLLSLIPISHLKYSEKYVVISLSAAVLLNLYFLISFVANIFSRHFNF